MNLKNIRTWLNTDEDQWDMAENVEISTGEKMSRYLRDIFSNGKDRVKSNKSI